MNKDPMTKLSFLLFITFVIDLAVILDFINGNLVYIKIFYALTSTVVSAYYLISLKFDGLLAFMADENTDERIRNIWNKARSNGFYVLMFFTWFSPLWINNPKFSFIVSNISTYLVSITSISFIVVILSVVWLKYKI